MLTLRKCSFLFLWVAWYRESSVNSFGVSRFQQLSLVQSDAVKSYQLHVLRDSQIYLLVTGTRKTNLRFMLKLRYSALSRIYVISTWFFFLRNSFLPRLHVFEEVLRKFLWRLQVEIKERSLCRSVSSSLSCRAAESSGLDGVASHWCVFSFLIHQFSPLNSFWRSSVLLSHLVLRVCLSFIKSSHQWSLSSVILWEPACTLLWGLLKVWCLFPQELVELLQTHFSGLLEVRPQNATSRRWARFYNKKHFCEWARAHTQR